METSRFYPYVSCLVDLPPATAVAGFDFACHCLTVAGHPAVEVASGRLVLTGEVVRAQPDHYAPWRSVRGALRPGGWASGPVAVQLELLPWSRTRSELGLVHVDRRWPSPTERRYRAYLRAAHATLGVLGRHVSDPPAEWLFRLAGSDEMFRPRRGHPAMER